MSDVCAILIDPYSRKISFGFPQKGPTKLTGIYALVQLSAFTILRRFKGDQFRPDYGSKFLSLPGTATINDINALRADIAIIIKDSESAILSEQSSHDNLPASEKLVSLTLKQVVQDNTDPTIINIYVDVKNAVNESFVFGIPNK